MDQLDRSDGLEDLTIRAFSERLGSDAPAPGGGSAAALNGALGAALVRMAAALTMGKAAYRGHQDLAEELLAEAEELRRRFLDVMERDTQAFNGVITVSAMPKSTEEEKAERRKALQNALAACTQTPYEIMELALAGLELAEKALSKTNQNAVSDLGVAALSLKAAAQGAWLNILINAGAIADKRLAEHYLAGGRSILEKSLPLADSIHGRILTELELRAK